MDQKSKAISADCLLSKPGDEGALVDVDNTNSRIKVVYSATDVEPHISTLVELYEQQWWSKGRKNLDDIRRMIHNSVNTALIDERTGSLIGYARVLTDKVYMVMLFDVMIMTSYQGKGLGKRLMEAVLANPELQGVKQLALYCLPEMVPFYEKCGFVDSNDPNLILLRKDNTTTTT